MNMREHAALFYERQNSRVAARCQKIFRPKTSRIHIYIYMYIFIYTILEADFLELCSLPIFFYFYFISSICYLVWQEDYHGWKTYLRIFVIYYICFVFENFHFHIIVLRCVISNLYYIVIFFFFGSIWYFLNTLHRENMF